MGRPCANPVAIYLMRLSGHVYVGKHEHADAAGWPTRGQGPLPSGYSGSGLVWRRVVRKHGADRIRWSLLRVVPPGGDWEGTEREEIARVREKYPGRCANVYDGGDGFTGDDMRRLWSDPEHREMMRGVGRRVGRESWRDPVRRERMLAALAKGQKTAMRAESRRKRSASRRQQWTDPEYRQRHLAPLLGSQSEAARKGADTWLLRAALRRRDAGEPPLFYDNRVLAEAGEAENSQPMPPPRSPLPRSKVGEALRALQRGPHTPDSPGAEIGLSAQEARYKVDQLVRLGWPVQNEGGVYHLRK